MANLVYLSCAITSLLCVFLVWRGYSKSKNRLLLWCGICFAGFALNNILLFSDLVLYPDLDFSTIRTVPALLGLLVLIYGLIQETTD